MDAAEADAEAQQQPTANGRLPANVAPGPPRGGGAARPPVRGRAQNSAPAPHVGAGQPDPPYGAGRTSTEAKK